MDDHSIKVLEFDEIISMLRERTACPLGDEEACLIRPISDLHAIMESQEETTEAKEIIMNDGALPLGGVHDIRIYVNKAILDSLLQPSELQDIADTLISAKRLKSFIMKRSEQMPRLASITANIGIFTTIEDGIRQSVGINGEIVDSASPELAKIRGKLKAVHAKIIDRLHSIIQSPEYRTMIQDPVVTQRGDRYCIPVKSEFRQQFQGIVHDSSASGATVFIEPASVVDLGNDLKELAVAEKQEIEKILRKLTMLVKSNAEDIFNTTKALGRIDFISAKAILSCDMDACQPKMSIDKKLDLLNARHPLIKGNVVPISVQLGFRFNTLLITGPNTGGKTVALKTIGLLTIMAHSGLHIPADDGSMIPVLDSVFADIGDEQSIQQSLSTFSAHMRNIVHIINNVTPKSLVLLDEIGAGTDPEEGAALAKAILDYLRQVGTLTAATTHYGELKEYAFVTDGVENASVEFDIQTLQPTYKLLIGVPGSSNALAIASRLGMPDEIIDSARKMIRGANSSEDIIRKIEESRRAAVEKEHMAERASKDAEILRSRYEERLDELERIKRELRAQFAEEFDRKIREKIDELDVLLDEIKAHKDEPKVVHEARQLFKEYINEVDREVNAMLPPVRAEIDENYTPQPGDNVRIITLDVDGVLMNNPQDAEAQVMVGSMKVNVPFSAIKPIKKQPQERKPERTMHVPEAKAANISPELKLIAQRVEQALVNLDKYLDDAYLAGLPSVRIIHGKGTGRLKKAVWEFLSTHYAVESYHLADSKSGGSGVTIVEFKK